MPGALRARGTALLIECADENAAKLCLRVRKQHLVAQARSEAAFRMAVRALGLGMGTN